MLVGSSSHLVVLSTLSVTHSRIIALFCSKEGSAQVRLKLALFGDETGHNFTFSAPQPVAVAEREKFKQELTSIISRNKNTTEGLPKSLTPLKVTNAPPIFANPTPSALSPKQYLTPSHNPVSRAPSERRATPVITGSDPASDFRLRKKVLMSNPELGSLHRDLVMTGQITEGEFWDGREVSAMYCSTLFRTNLCAIAFDFSSGSIRKPAERQTRATCGSST
jgi:transcription initiation factor TFIIH subunit 1